MSTPEQEAAALVLAQRFLWDLGNGAQPINGHVRELRARALDISKHYPLAPGSTWLRLHGIDPDQEGK